jgi:hypothetical protein
VGCGYGFGNHQFRDMRSTAVAFARALQAGDTVRMRELSWGRIEDSVTAIGREVPPAYIQFATPTPELVTVEGGGIYQGSDFAEFLVSSARLDSCRGGVQVGVLMFDKTPRVTSVQLVPPLDSLPNDACRTAIDRS